MLVVDYRDGYRGGVLYKTVDEVMKEVRERYSDATRADQWEAVVPLGEGSGWYDALLMVWPDKTTRADNEAIVFIANRTDEPPEIGARLHYRTKVCPGCGGHGDRSAMSGAHLPYRSTCDDCRGTGVVSL